MSTQHAWCIAAAFFPLFCPGFSRSAVHHSRQELKRLSIHVQLANRLGRQTRKPTLAQEYAPRLVNQPWSPWFMIADSSRTRPIWQLTERKPNKKKTIRLAEDDHPSPGFSGFFRLETTIMMLKKSTNGGNLSDVELWRHVMAATSQVNVGHRLAAAWKPSEHWMTTG